MHPEPPPPPNVDALLAALDAVRQERGLTWEALADRAGLGRRSIFSLRSRPGGGTIATWHALAWALDVPLGTLVDHLRDDA